MKTIEPASEWAKAVIDDCNLTRGFIYQEINNIRERQVRGEKLPPLDIAATRRDVLIRAAVNAVKEIEELGY